MPMQGLEKLKVVSFWKDRVDNPHPRGDLPWQVYHAVRNAIVRTCRKHGPTGPRGERRLDLGYMQSATAWEKGDPDPWYYIIDDQYDDERYLYAELYGDDPFTPAWLADITVTLRAHAHAGWGIGVKNIPESYILIFGHRLMVNGPHLSGCKDAGAIIAVVRRLRARGKKR